jgi:hypothetical protein
LRVESGDRERGKKCPWVVLLVPAPPRDVPPKTKRQKKRGGREGVVVRYIYMKVK